MPRKKKEEITQTCEIVNGIKSSGNVKINVYKGDRLCKTINQHNAGTAYLCRYLRDVAIGIGTSVDQPTIIKPCTLSGTGATSKLIPITNQGVPFSSRWRTKDTEGALDATAVIKFIIPWTLLSINKEIGGFQLFSKNKNMCAYIKLNEADKIKVESLTNIEVEWSLKISVSTESAG